jgi:hypothetical protein
MGIELDIYCNICSLHHLSKYRSNKGMWKVFNLKAGPVQGGITEKRILNIKHTYLHQRTHSLDYEHQLHKPIWLHWLIFNGEGVGLYC